MSSDEQTNQRSNVKLHLDFALLGPKASQASRVSQASQTSRVSQASRVSRRHSEQHEMSPTWRCEQPRGVCTAGVLSTTRSGSSSPCFSPRRTQPAWTLHSPPSLIINRNQMRLVTARTLQQPATPFERARDLVTQHAGFFVGTMFGLKRVQHGRRDEAFIQAKR